MDRPNENGGEEGSIKGNIIERVVKRRRFRRTQLTRLSVYDEGPPEGGDPILILFEG